jgi:hypothetical protein
MTNVEPTVEPAPLFVHNGGKSRASEPGQLVVTIRRRSPDSVQIDDPRISLRVESTDVRWRGINNSPNGMFRQRTAREFGDGHRLNNGPHGRSHGRQGVDV